jgi:hypothetical protein
MNEIFRFKYSRWLVYFNFIILFPALTFPSLFDFLFGSQTRFFINIYAIISIFILSFLTRYRVFALIILFFMLLNYFSIVLIHEYNLFLIVPFVGFLAGLIFSNYIKFLKNYALIFLLFNFFVLLFENSITYNPFFGDLESAMYKSGIFKISKDTAEYLLILGLLFRRNFIVNTIIFISGVISGIRAAWVGIVLLYSLDLFFSKNYSSKISINTRTNFSKVIIIFCFFLILISTFIFSNNIIFYRYEILFDFNSSTYTSRSDFILQHLECIMGLPLLNFLFGSGNYCAFIVDNGSENFIIAFFEYYGVISLILGFLFLLIYSINFISSKKFRIYYSPFVIILIVGLFVRFPMSFFGWFVIGYYYSIYITRRWLVN